MDTALIKTLKEIFKQFPNFWSGENLQRSLVIDAIQKKEADVIKALINNEKVKTIYSIDIDDVLIFDFDKLISLLKYKEYWADSFTKYRNKIGLTSNGKYLDFSSDVILDFPYKDCVLEGGMTKEDQGKNEIYYNEVIARDEIDRLFSSKVFTNTKRYNKDGIEEKVTEFKDSDNLIIKGNNLIALHSVKERYKSKIKLIYIDPPYNTGEDSFKYNDRFNHSTWLTFMKNRLSVSKELLHKSGCIFIQIDYKELAYLKVLCDEIFGIENFVQIISVKTATPAGFKVVNPGPVNVTEFVLMYTKNKSEYNFKKGYVEAPYQKDYKYYVVNPDSDYADWIISDVKTKALELLNVEDEKQLKAQYGKDIATVILEKKIEDFVLNNPSVVFATYRPHKPAGVLKELMQKSLSCPDEIVHYERENNTPFLLKAGRLLAFYDKKLKEIDGKLVSTQLLTDFWGDLSWDTLSSEGGVEFKNGKKPEKFLKRIIEVYSNDGDIILDFHLGSGTTCAVAHKLGRQYIGIEQLDYGENDSIVRLKNVINGEQSGISKSVNWQGGGSFVYTELMELNYLFIHKIQQAETTEDLIQLFEEMKIEAHLNYQIDLGKVLNNQYEIEGIDHFLSFNDLELAQQKQLLIELLDKNQLYVNASEMDDENLAISESDKAFTTSFYQGGE
ncbi:site-specific DNA-methyltransferase [Acinetobacter baumannii]|uniref:site-specific DNA-methyltransferase n=1 Tax=Acinetobacter baumannii TaxID=470 RepID=UPI00028ECE6B|nr:site-specific DNA-methyltransferase [Acinetobacter baumannii]EHU1439993.1 site-specific DNA-methyltransferase [Acinetobacter baumannii]EHU1807830.1 site-specific DNA-methyltransferase [Acinetobacter baumannii]EHU2697652.1 site-specific DNA-methyltransferase [Acinetobacter baumannii]EKL59340.1 DNA methylase family protein [Acinetobacter baumannii OIFC110]TPT87435.1 site-specific DNA-methyltransferase [Acinetobacter baumannii]